jgi:capsular polysaccharide biosynthesis protein
MLELDDAILVPGGGVVWRDYWIGPTIQDFPDYLYEADWRPGDFDADRRTVEIPPERMVPDLVIEEPLLFCDPAHAADNFGHFVHDFLPYGLLFRKLRKIHPELLPLSPPMSWESQKQLIEAVFGLPYAACPQPGYITGARRLFVPRQQSNLGGPVWSVSFAGLRAARALALRAFAIEPPVHSALLASPTKVFLHREQNTEYLAAANSLQGRDYSNVPELMALMLRRGFVALDPGRVPLDAVAAVLARATTVVGIYGANLGNILFSPPGARILELRSHSGNWQDYEALAAVLGQEFQIAPQPPHDPSEPPRIDVTALEALL